ncbi:peptidase S41 family protein-like protein [Pleomassaria siparia CBS 279.74]|uniref:Peptidase S41 family protein-like protein n=1 Tax=Pleomassaria siparia CBS 279.74 TaxID=1314801 RepID=A0A6G1KE52_9PLEO|nr:peptidase S41 family protein-like protein [Pleomassaria siparia CBS 279.74]
MAESLLHTPPQSLPQSQSQSQSQSQPVRPRQQDPASPPCAQVSQILYVSGSIAKVPTVPANIAYDCIRSVPFNATSAKALLAAIPAYINWQSTLTVLKDPPAEYAEKVQPAVDIVGGLADLTAAIDAGEFTSEYDFGWKLYTLIQSAHDGHFSYIPDSVGTIFSYGRDVPLVSVSEDGSKLPSVFAFNDVLGIQFKNITYTPSPVVQIDGKDVNEFLESWSQYGSLQDRDALYNNVFYELAQVGLGLSGSGTGTFTGGGRGRFVYPGETTTLKFANGTEYTMHNYARVLQSFRNINSGEDLAKQWFFFGASVAEAQSVSTQAESAAMPGYPQPVFAGPSNLINAFYIDTPGYEEYAVLQVPNFVGDSSAETGFQQVTQKFLPKAVADGKTKLIIDVQANGGGTILQGYDMFKQLFPSLDPYGANRFRAHEAIDLIGQSFSEYASKYPRSLNQTSSVKQVQGSFFDYHSDMTVDGKPWSSWAEKFGPVETNGDKYTSTGRWNLNDPLIPWNSGGINITGYGPLANVSNASPFKPENIVILTDGYCASTCTIFSELMTKQAGVKTIALGGRSNKNQIQAIGGVKGTNNLQWGYIQSQAQIALRVATGDLQATLNSSTLRTDYSGDIVFNRAASSPGVNVRDGLLLNDTSGVALQFIYEEADCRLYYTPEMTVDITAVWRAAGDAIWGTGGKCVGGGYDKRTAHEVTAHLKPRRVQFSDAAALKQFEAFERSLQLETSCSLKGDGFMEP